MKVLFLSHESSRTGAPIVLLEFLKWLKQNQPQVKCDVLALKPGELSGDFKEYTNAYLELKESNEVELTFIQIAKKKGLKRLGLLKKEKNASEIVLDEVKNRNPGVIYANSILALDMGVRIKSMYPEIKLICHVHELNTIIKTSVSNFEENSIYVDQWIAVSNMVKNSLINNQNINSKLIETVYEFSSNEIRNSYNSNSTNEFVVGGCGTVHWRKGTDFFILVARHINSKYPELPIKFIWVGEISDFQKTILIADLQKSKLEDKVFFTGHTNDPYSFYNKMSVFLLTSREDPFPLVALEAGKMGKPIIAFDKASGTIEFIVDDCGVVVDYMDVEAMAEAVVHYCKNSKVLNLHSKNIKDKFKSFSPEVICPQLYTLIVKNA